VQNDYTDTQATIYSESAGGELPYYKTEDNMGMMVSYTQVVALGRASHDSGPRDMNEEEDSEEEDDHVQQ
jgi:hypothetical protein